MSKQDTIELEITAVMIATELGVEIPPQLLPTKAAICFVEDLLERKEGETPKFSTFMLKSREEMPLEDPQLEMIAEMILEGSTVEQIFREIPIKNNREKRLAGIMLYMLVSRETGLGVDMQKLSDLLEVRLGLGEIET